ncbi:MAG: CoA-transferase [Bacteroides sp.]|nr:CoA-transferase [Bacteroides sp.]
MKVKKLTAPEAVEAIQSGDTLVVGGSGAGHGIPDKLLQALGERYVSSGQPANLTVLNPCGVGDNENRGLNFLAHEGLIKRNIGGFWGNAPKLGKLALENKLEAYNLPQGALTHLVRAIAGGEPGLFTRTGLNTFVDPEFEGGRINEITTEDLVEKHNFNGEDILFYRSFPLDVAFIRGTSADMEGNITSEEEVGTFSMLSLAQAVKASGGTVIAQVKRINESAHALPVQVKVPGILVDYVVEVPEQQMTFLTDYNEALVRKDAPFEEGDLVLEGAKRLIARRAALELKKGYKVNLGYGMPDGVPIVAKEEKIIEDITFLIEQGPIGGVLTTGLNFGAMYNPSAIVDDGYQFDFFHGGGLDICFLGFAQVDKYGNVNSSRFGSNLTGCGGFIDISQNTRKVVFCGGFSTKTKMTFDDEGVQIEYPGKHKKFVESVQQITFNGRYAAQKGQEVFYVTERAIFKLNPEGLELIEIAPGADLEKDVLAMMEFKPIIKEVKQINKVVYKSSTMGFVL